MLIEQLDQLGEIGERAGEAVDLIDHHDVFAIFESDHSQFGNPPNESRIQGLGIRGLANETNRVAIGYGIPIDDRFQRP